MAIEIDQSRKDHLATSFQAFFLDQFDEELSRFRADELLNFVLDALGPQVYNQAVQDARKFMQQRLDDLDGEVHVPEKL